MTAKPRVAFVVAVARNGVIGSDGGLPWHISSDLKRFKALTMGKPVIMGRKTWESLPRKPLPGRTNIVVTRQGDYQAPDAVVVSTPIEALSRAAALNPTEIAVIGGGEIFSQLMPFADRLYLSEIDLDAPGDTVFPTVDPTEWNEVSRETHAGQEGEAAGFVLRTLDRIGPARQY
jgi:dihydrofolate reductase